MNRAIKYKIVTVSISLLAVSVLAWGLQRKYSHFAAPKPKVVIKDSITKQPPYDTVLVNKYQHLFQKYDTLKTTYTMAGTINIVDQADSANNMKNVDFVFCKVGSSFYYKLGNTETINANGIYLFIDNQAKAMAISAQKDVAYDQQPNGFAQIGKTIIKEYAISAKTNGSTQTITLNNEHHASCKQISISYDTSNMAIKHIYSRLTNLQDPLRHDNEKKLDISISEWTSHANLDKYFNQDAIIIKGSGEWRVTGKYKEYHITNM